ncbi:HAMP domain-containing sensor histidine kinase [Spirosoma agri]|uniref:histidine kinase n=1 Tax=Spirosoma agri TaxID=1987381 RepID=A0A6M0IP56_9BACT|nr:HAMP domain-containing sensor histidine kinase [Spirosoma agri]NEU69141.1 HAMP domain-containing histidine kinase [Spirosoma agri]
MNLRSRIVLAITAVFAAVSLLAGWLMLTRAEKSLQNAFDRAVQTRAGWLLSQVSVDPVVLPLPTESEQMLVTYQTYGRWRELFRSPGFPAASGIGRDANRHPRSYRSKTVQNSSLQLSNGQLNLTLAVPDASLIQDIERLRWVFGLGWFVGLILAFLGGYAVAGWLLKPIQAIVNQASKITNTTTIEPLDLPATQDELYQLTNTLNQMLARIRESAELQQNFFGAAAHELRTPLAVMKTGLEVTLDSGQVDGRTAPFLLGQLDEVRRLTRLLDEFLTLSRPDKTSQSLRIESVDLATLINQCLSQLAGAATDYEVSTRFDEPDFAIQPISTDGVKLAHVVLNLVENAIKYAVPNSVVVVQLSGETVPMIRVQNQTVCETGPVLDLMQPYFRANPFKDGHGLGLWISHQLTTLLGGELHLEWQGFIFVSTLVLPQEVRSGQPIKS